MTYADVPAKTSVQFGRMRAEDRAPAGQPAPAWGKDPGICGFHAAVTERL